MLQLITVVNESSESSSELVVRAMQQVLIMEDNGWSEEEHSC